MEQAFYCILIVLTRVTCVSSFYKHAYYLFVVIGNAYHRLALVSLLILYADIKSTEGMNTVQCEKV